MKNNYFDGEELAQNIWESKYRLGNETLDEFFERLAKEFSRMDNVKKNFEELSEEQQKALSSYGKQRFSTNSRFTTFLELFQNFKYIIPGGSVLSGVGNPKPVSLSNCFVIDTKDSIEEIFESARKMSEIYKRRGGVGLDLSVIRPAGAPVNNAAKTTGGVVPFMELYSQVTNTIGQEGRRGALMLSIDINHPDSPEFITAKQDLTKITGANVSVRISDDFMKAVKNDEDYLLRWPCDLIKPKWMFEEQVKNCNYNELVEVENDLGTIKGYVKKVKAKELWDSVIKSAWNSAEPGILFWDTIINNDPASVYEDFKAVSTNPCGEIPLSPYDSCRLIASNLYSLVDNPFNENSVINEDLAYKVFYEAQIIADILVDLELEAADKIISFTTGLEQELWIKIKEIGEKGRRTGTGITGLGDMLAALNLPYDHIEIIDYIMRLKMKAELDATIDLAIINGSFPAYQGGLEWGINETVPQNNFYNFLLEQFPHQVEKMQIWGRRNISFSTIAPTGTISLEAGVTSGGEPLFSIYHTRRKKCNPGEIADFVDQNGVGFKNYNVVHSKFKEWFIIATQYEHSRKTALEILENLSKEELEKFIIESPWYLNTAEDISPARRVLVQSTLQTYTTHSISSTVNLPEKASVEDVAIIYNDAFKYSCKGITTYRDGSRTGILVKENNSKISDVRPEELDCKVLRFKNEDRKNWISFIGIFNNKAYEIFTGINDLDELPIPSYIEDGKIIKVALPEGSRYDFSYVDKYGYINTVGGLNRVFHKEYWNYARFVSALLRENTPVEKVIKVIDGLNFTNKGMNSFQTGLIRSLKSFIPDGTKAPGAVCSNCKSTNIIYEGGCMICRDCGNSKC